MNNDKIELTRDVEATLIPQGTKMNLNKGDSVVITHRLGGNFTIMTENGMFRIDGKNADAINEEIPKNQNEDNLKINGEIRLEDLFKSLKKVYDPEIPVNIVDLGLVYKLELDKQDNKNINVEMEMTLTAPGCGMGPAIAEDAKNCLENIPGINQAKVSIVWDPPWDQEMISEEGKMILGLI